MKPLECDKDFFRDGTGLSFWSHHGTYSGVPMLPKRGTKKQKVHE